jgi:hypothetical protein
VLDCEPGDQRRELGIGKRTPAVPVHDVRQLTIYSPAVVSTGSSHDDLIGRQSAHELGREPLHTPAPRRKMTGYHQGLEKAL